MLRAAQSVADALGIRADTSELIALTGGGGKTSAMFALASQLKARGAGVLVTTTTAIFVPPRSAYDALVVSERPQGPPAGGGSVTVAGRAISSGGKLLGVAPGAADGAYGSGAFGYVLVEADGAKQRPVKAPAGHEPVVPAKTTVLVGVVGFDAYGKPVGGEWVHRPALFAEVTGRREGDAIDETALIRLAVSERGLFKNSPAGARRVMLINKVSGREHLAAALRIGRAVLEKGVERVVIGCVRDGALTVMGGRE